jgi:nucleotide-binding universal stress UspA family protein
MEIVVGIDGSEQAQKALTWAAGEARVHHAELTVVHAWSFALAAGIPTPASSVAVDVIEKSAQACLDTALQAVDLSGLDVTPRLVCGAPAAALIEAAKGADLVVVGSRGHGGFVGLLLGSVSQQVTHHAPCPVVIVPES